MSKAVKDIDTLRNDKLGPRLVETFKKRNFDAWYFSNSEDALKQVESLIPKDHVVAWGGSMTLDELGIKDLMREKYTVIDRDSTSDQNERLMLMRKALSCDTFLISANAISETGELINIDAFGNRVAAMIFGPKQVIVVAGMNKVVKTLKDAYQRARTIASPLNLQRLPGRVTSCSVTGTCGDCTTPGCICTYIVTTRTCMPAGRIKIILINDSLGL